MQLLLMLTPCKHSRAEYASHDARHLQSTSSSRASELQQHVQILLHKCPLPGCCIRDKGLPSASEYLSSSPVHIGMQRQREIITHFLAGSGFQVCVRGKRLINSILKNITRRTREDAAEVCTMIAAVQLCSTPCVCTAYHFAQDSAGHHGTRGFQLPAATNSCL